MMEVTGWGQPPLLFFRTYTLTPRYSPLPPCLSQVLTDYSLFLISWMVLPLGT